MPAELLAGLEGALQIDPATGLPIPKAGPLRVSLETSDVKMLPGAAARTLVAVRQAPSQAIEAPTAMLSRRKPSGA